jgi:hypothetical protein
MDHALAAVEPFGTVAPAVRRAAELARFADRAPRDGPFFPAALSPAVPEPPEQPLLPALQAVRGDARLEPVVDALETLQYELVWSADCAEFSDAVHDSRQYLHAAGHVELAHRAVLALAGPGLGIVLAPPATVRELAASLGRQVADLALYGTASMGSLIVSRLGLSFTYAWDVHREEPVASGEALAPRVLRSYRVQLASASACEAVLRAAHGAPVEVAGRRRYGPFLLDAHELEWNDRPPGWALTPGERAAGADALAALVERLRDLRSADELDKLALGEGIRRDGAGGFALDPPLPAPEVAAILGAPDAFGRTVDVHMSSWRLVTTAGEPRVGSWRIEAALEDRPIGDPVPGVSIPAASVRLLGGGEMVTHLRVEPEAR